jgi:hypothetical protein
MNHNWKRYTDPSIKSGAKSGWWECQNCHSLTRCREGIPSPMSAEIYRDHVRVATFMTCMEAQAADVHES